MKLKEAEARAEFAEKTVKKLQKEVDRLEGKLLIFFFFPAFFRYIIFKYNTQVSNKFQSSFYKYAGGFFFLKKNIHYFVTAEYFQSAFVTNLNGYLM